MKKYYNPENERVQYVVRETMNGYCPMMLNVNTGEMVAITPKTAAQYEIWLPEVALAQSCARTTAERYLEKLAFLNGWVEVENE